MSVLRRKVWTGACAAALGLYMLFNLWSRQVQLELIDHSEDGRVNRNASSILSIETAHNEGIRHRGVWLHIVNENNELLLLKRSDEAVTCPSTWNAPGEHTKYLESYLDTAYRGLNEELWLTKENILLIAPLTAAPVLLELHYGPPLNKYDLQWTQSFLVRVRKDSIANRNEEASAMEWIPLVSLKEVLQAKQLKFCAVETFAFTSEELGAQKTATTFQDMLMLHAKLITAILDRNPSP